MEQLCLFPEAAAPRPPRRRPQDLVFFAVRARALDRSPNRLIADLRQRFGLTGPDRPRETWHVSLLRVGLFERLTPIDIDMLCAAAARVAPPTFDLLFDRVGSFGRSEQRGQRPLVLWGGPGAADIVGLARDIEHALLGSGHVPDGEAIAVPHLTLLYDPVRVPLLPLVQPIRLRVTGFALIHSLRGQSRYEQMWP